MRPAPARDILRQPATAGTAREPQKTADRRGDRRGLAKLAQGRGARRWPQLSVRCVGRARAARRSNATSRPAPMNGKISKRTGSREFWRTQTIRPSRMTSLPARMVVRDKAQLNNLAASAGASERCSPLHPSIMEEVYLAWPRMFGDVVAFFDQPPVSPN